MGSGESVVAMSAYMGSTCGSGGMCEICMRLARGLGGWVSKR